MVRPTLALIILTVVSPCLALQSPSTGRVPNSDPGHASYVTLRALRFSCPRNFEVVSRSGDASFVLMMRRDYDLALAVAVLPKAAGDLTPVDFADKVVASGYCLAKKPYEWKRVSSYTYQKVSKYEVEGGLLKGFNGELMVYVQYRLLLIDERPVFVGYALNFNEYNDAAANAEDWDQDTGGDSMPGWYAQAHLISSLTGESYDVINPPDSRISAPPPSGP